MRGSWLWRGHGFRHILSILLWKRHTVLRRLQRRPLFWSRLSVLQPGLFSRLSASGTTGDRKRPWFDYNSRCKATTMATSAERRRRPDSERQASDSGCRGKCASGQRRIAVQSFFGSAGTAGERPQQITQKSGNRTACVKELVQASMGAILASAATKASISALVLYIASDARTVPSIPRVSISGWAQWWPVRTSTPRWSSSTPVS